MDELAQRYFKIISRMIDENKTTKEKITNHIDVDVNLKNSVINGDALNVLKKIDADTFHLTFTSPPYYNARDYSIYKSLFINIIKLNSFKSKIKKYINYYFNYLILKYYF